MKLSLTIAITVLGIAAAAVVEFVYGWIPFQGAMFLAGFGRLATLGLLVFALVLVFRLWRNYRFASLIPFALVSLFVFRGCEFVSDAGEQLGRKRFLARLPQYEDVVGRIRHEVSAPCRGCRWDALPAVGDYVGYAALSESGTNGTLTVRLLQAVTFNSHHRIFVYRSDGDIKAALSKREHIQYQINSNWWAVAD